MFWAVREFFLALNFLSLTYLAHLISVRMWFYISGLKFSEESQLLRLKDQEDSLLYLRLQKHEAYSFCDDMVVGESLG